MSNVLLGVRPLSGQTAPGPHQTGQAGKMLLGPWQPLAGNLDMDFDGPVDGSGSGSGCGILQGLGPGCVVLWAQRNYPSGVVGGLMTMR